MKKRILAVLATGLLLVGTTTTCLAGSEGLTDSLTSTLAKASFQHSTMGGGQRLEVSHRVVERRDSDGLRLAVSNYGVSVGGASTVSAQRQVTAGYKYDEALWVRGYVNSVVYAERIYRID